MNGAPSRVAVQVGAGTVRVAGVVAGAEPWLVAERPGATADVAGLLSELLGPAVPELVVVHPPTWSAARVAACTGDLAGMAGWLRSVPAPRAATTVLPRLVLDVGSGGTELTRLAADGSVSTCRTAEVGGARLDEVVVGWSRSRAGRPERMPGEPTSSELAEVRRIRERLSLLPAVESVLGGPEPPVQIGATELDALLAGPLREAVDLLRDELSEGGPAPVLLIGGVARAPLLAELLDVAGCPDVVVAPRPDLAAVLGALRAPAATTAASCGRDPPTPGGGPVGEPDVGSVGPTGRGMAGLPVPQRAYFPPPPRRRPVRAALLALAAAALAAGLAAGLLGVGVALFPPTAAPVGVLVQYGYRLDVPQGWVHTGGLPERRRILLTPAATPEGSEVIAVEQTPLGYDSDAERPRALAELRAEFDAAVAGGSALSGYRVGTHAGRDVLRYEQHDSDGRAAVNWFVVLDGDSQFSVGCRHNAAGKPAVGAACALVVGSVRRS